MVEMVAAGRSQASIAEELGYHPKTVQRAVKHFLEVESRYPVGLDATQVELMRAEDLHSLEHAQQQLTSAHSAMPEPTSFNEHTEKVKVTALVAATQCKISERKAALYGLNAARPEVPTTSITNNMLVAGADEVTYLKNLARLKEIEAGRQ
jgi:hypothetical protein